MTHFLTLQNTYNNVEVALCTDGKLIDSATISKLQASSHLTINIHELLINNSLTLDNVSFIAANAGPGPFTTLRVVIATVNGLGFALKKSLIGVDGLDAFLDENKGNHITVALLNAFNNDVYFGIDSPAGRIKGCKKINLLLSDLSTYDMSKVRFIGSGITVFKEDIQKVFPHITIPDSLPEHVSLATIATHAWHHWQNKSSLQQQLLPLYLKSEITLP